MSASKMTPIEYFEPQDADQDEVYIIVRAKMVDGHPWQEHAMYLARWDQIAGFHCRNAILHDVTDFKITDIKVSE